MHYNVRDRVKIISCPNPEFVGKVGEVTMVRVNGTYNVRPDSMTRQVYLYDAEIRPA